MTAHSSATSPHAPRQAVGPVLGLVLMALLSSLPASACAVCFGDPNSSQTYGMNWAILTMLGFIAAVFAGLIAFAVRLRRRALAPYESATDIPTNAVFEGGPTL